MKQRKMIAAGALALGLALLPQLGLADVHDNAHLFGASAVSSADAAMAQMASRHGGKTLVVETFASVPADQQAALQQQGKEAFFKEWADSRAHALGVNGVYAIACMDPHYIEVEAGRNTRERHEITPGDLATIRSDLTTAFRDKQYDQGLSNATEAVERAYTANIGGAAPAPGMTPSNGTSTNNSRSTPAMPSTGHYGTLICVGVGLLILFGLFRGIFGRRNMTGGGGMMGGGNYPTGGPNYGPGPGTGANYGPGYGGGPGYGAPQARGGGFGSGLLGGLLGGAVGGIAADRFEHRNDPAGGGAASGGGIFGGGGGGGSADAGPSDAGQGFGDFSSGGDFGGGGGGDAGGGGGGDSGGGSSGGDF